MTSIVLHSTSGPDGKLRLELPAGAPNTEFEVEVAIRPRVRARILPAGYFELIGSVDDESLRVQPQPPLPPPLDVE